MALPLWVRVLDGVGRFTYAVERAEELIRGELLLAFLAEHQRSEFTFVAYSKFKSYLPGGDAFERGLSSWESQLLQHPDVPRQGKVLLGGAGGGRELQALGKMGYSVFAFEPVEPLFRGAKQVASCFPDSDCVRASFADLALAARGLGPLAAAPAPFDLIYFGWGSFTHLTRFEEQLETLRSARRLAPQAPVVLSFWLYRAPPSSRAERLRQRLRGALRWAGVEPPPPGLVFHPGPGFGYRFTRDEIEALAERAGYRIALFSEETFPHALLLPSGSAAPA